MTNPPFRFDRETPPIEDLLSCFESDGDPLEPYIEALREEGLSQSEIQDIVAEANRKGVVATFGETGGN